MENTNALSRRGFLRSASTLGAFNCLRLGAPAATAIAQLAVKAHAADAVLTILDDADAADLSAIAARIIPTTATPGATEAGVIHFMDQAFAAEMRPLLEPALEGLGNVNAAIAGRFADLDNAAQDECLRELEGGPFFNLLWSMTIFGFFAMSKYGGNRDHVGWELVGFDGHHGAWQYPFGYYDAEIDKAMTDGE